MNSKILEIRDRGTFIGVLAIEMVPRILEGTAGRVDEIEQYYLKRAGYPRDFPCILVVRLECRGFKVQATYDPFDWLEDNNRTLHVAHVHIEQYWRQLANGAVIDVECLLGERPTPKQSERLEPWNPTP